MSVEIKNLAQFDAEVNKWFGSVERAITEAAVGLAHEAFNEILETAPQFSGDFVANTKVSVGAPDASFQEDVFPGKLKDPFQMGSSPAQEHARSHANWKRPKLGQSVFISSSAKHDEPYAWLIENGQIKLRPVNQGGSYIYRRAAANTAHRFGKIGKVQLEILRNAAK